MSKDEKHVLIPPKSSTTEMSYTNESSDIASWLPSFDLPIPNTLPDLSHSVDPAKIRLSNDETSLVKIGQYSETAAQFTPMSLSWKDVNVRVKLKTKKTSSCKSQGIQEKHILKGVSGIVKPGTLLAIMGASGAGKTTLMNILTARNIKDLSLSGDIRVNGHKVKERMRNISAYVQQDDLFIGTLTVREQLQFRAMLRMSESLTKEDRLRRVEEVILEMGLTKCADSRIGDGFGSSRSISGGERKRLSFASETLTNPPLMFCDEPTSGLDSFMAMNIVNVLKLMASKRHTILCTIHQPSSEVFALFNRILIMSEGRTAFCGSPEAAKDFFSTLNFPCPPYFNPADHYILTLAIQPGKEEETREKSKKICDGFDNSPKAKEILQDIEEEAKGSNLELKNAVEKDSSGVQSSWLIQMRYLFWRSWVTQFRNKILFRIRFVQSFIIAAVFGLIYLRLTIDQTGVMNLNGALFVLLISVSFSNMFAVLNSFPMELDIFMREYGSGIYRSDVYFLTKTISEIPMFLMISIIFVSVAYWMIGLYPHLDAFLMAQLVYFITACVGISFGYFVSTMAGSVTIALAIAPPLLIPIMLFGGLFINNDDIPVYFQWLKYISWFRYSNEILMVNQWKNIEHIDCPGRNQTAIEPGSSGGRCLFRNGRDVLAYTSFDEDNVIFDLEILFVLLVGFRVLAFLTLLIRAKRSKE